MSDQSQAGLANRPKLSAVQAVPAPAQVRCLVLVPRKIIRSLLWIVAALVSIHLLTQLAIVYFSDFIGRDWLNIMFGLGKEANLPATFSGGLLLFSSLLLGAIALQKRHSGAPLAFQWTLLSSVFFFLSLDEIAVIHDNLTVPLRRLTESDGIFYFAWVIPYGLVTALLFLSLLKLLFKLPSTTRRLFLLAGVLYVGSALGMEPIDGYSKSQATNTGPLAFMSVAIEETLEMLGVIVFIHALLSYIERGLPGFALQLRVASAPDRKPIS